MAAIMSPYSTVGFYKTPVTKCLLCTVFVSTFSLNVPQFAPLKKYFTCCIMDIFDRGDSFLLATGSMTITLELVALTLFRRFDVDIFRGSLGYLASGPFELVFPMFVNYYADIPGVAQTYVMGVPVTGKMLTYLLGLQDLSFSNNIHMELLQWFDAKMIASSPSSTLCGVCSLLSGLLYRYNVLRIQSWLSVPTFLVRLAGSTLGRLVASSPPQDGIIPMGATLEIQRSQHLELLEQQMLFSRARDVRAFGQLYGNVVNHNQYQEYVDNGAVRHRNPAAHFSDDSDDSAEAANETSDRAGPSVRLNESQVQVLMEMGFERHKVMAALRNSGNDVNVATSLLLQDS